MLIYRLRLFRLELGFYVLWLRDGLGGVGGPGRDLLGDWHRWIGWDSRRSYLLYHC